MVILLKFVLLFVVGLIDIHCDCANSCKTNDKKSMPSDDANRLGKPSMVSPKIVKTEGTENIRNNFYGDANMDSRNNPDVYPCCRKISMCDKLDLIVALKLEKEGFRDFTNEDCEIFSRLMADGKIVRFVKQKKEKVAGKGSEAKIWFFDAETLRDILHVNVNECKVLKKLNERVYYFTVFSNEPLYKISDKEDPSILKWFDSNIFTKEYYDNNLKRPSSNGEDFNRFRDFKFPEISSETVFN